LTFLHYDPGWANPLAFPFTTSRSPEHDKHSAQISALVGSLAAQKSFSQFVIRFGLDESQACTFSLLKLLSELDSFWRLAVSKVVGGLWLIRV
jgi:hypothetical protein